MPSHCPQAIGKWLKEVAVPKFGDEFLAKGTLDKKEDVNEYIMMKVGCGWEAAGLHA